jgi:hypothetical protein
MAQRVKIELKEASSMPYQPATTLLPKANRFLLMLSPLKVGHRHGCNMPLVECPIPKSESRSTAAQRATALVHKPRTHG